MEPDNVGPDSNWSEFALEDNPWFYRSHYICPQHDLVYFGFTSRGLRRFVKQSSRGEANKAFLRVLKYSSGAVLEPAKLYKLKHLTKVEVISNDPSGCTFVLGFDNLRSQSVAPPQWTMRNIDDRNRLLFCILNMCKEILSYLPKVVGIDIVELALWAKVHVKTFSIYCERCLFVPDLSFIAFKYIGIGHQYYPLVI